jgi:hypothetical protein
VQLYTFLSALPALLGLAGFVLYQVLGANKSGDEITRRIVEKLRSAAAPDLPDQRLTPKQVERLLEQQQRLRKLVGEHDFRLLKQALTQQFVLTILVHVLALGFCGWSVYLFVQTPAVQQKAKVAPGATPPIIQTSTGDKSPNVNSSGSGKVTITIQDQTTPAKPDKKK